MKIIVTGAAGLVGQNLLPRLKAFGFTDIVAIDKHKTNTSILRRLHPDVTVIEADLAKSGAWADSFSGANVLVLNHAQIGALTEEPFIANNVTATQTVLAAAKLHGINYIVHISSSVVNSKAVDFYTESKKAQEQIVRDSGIPTCVLRPTLMFGWFDRKHLGWLARFMHRMPVFPVPGHGRYIRQPLYAGDFSSVIASAVQHPRPGGTYNISGQEKPTYIELIRAVKAASRAKARILHIPYGLFWVLLWVYGKFDANPPFTTRQLEALVIPEEFEIIDWPDIFGIRATPLAEALRETYQHPEYSKIILEF